MLIVSDFHDYYDSASSYGVDKTVVYNRKVTILVNPKLPEVPTPAGEDVFVRSPAQDFRIYKFVVGFCGRFYPVVKVLVSPRFQPLWTEHCFYNATSLIEFLSSKNFRFNKTKYAMRFFHIKDKSLMTEFFKENLWQPLSDVFVAHKTPIFAYGKDLTAEHQYKSTLIINPNISDYKFAKVKDPNSAFQEIYMYISGVLGTDPKPMVTISDKDKQAAKGHDGEYSFKKCPKGQWR